MEFEIWGLGFGVWGLGFEVWGLGFEVWGLGCGVWRILKSLGVTLGEVGQLRLDLFRVEVLGERVYGVCQL